MAGEDIFGGVVSSVGGGFVILLIVFVLGGGAILAFIMYKQKVGRYKQFKCVIWGYDGFGQIQERYDNAGIFEEGSTGNKRLFLKSYDSSLSPDNIPYIDDGKGGKVIYLFRTGLKNFKYIRPIISKEQVSFSVGEEDVNWALNSYEKYQKKFMSTLAQMLPIIIIVVSMLIVVILVYINLQRISEIVGGLKDVASALKDSAQAVAASKSGTTVIPA